MIVFEFPADARAKPGDLWYARRLRFDPAHGRLFAWVETVRREKFSYTRYIGRAFGAFDLATGLWQQLLPSNASADGLTLFAPAVSPGGSVIATGAFRDLHEYVLDPTRYRVQLLSASGAVRQLSTRVSRGPAGLAFSPEGQWLYGIEQRDLRPGSTPTSRHYCSAVARYDTAGVFARPAPSVVPEWEILGDMPRGGNGCCLAFTPDGRTLAVGRTDGDVTLFDTQTRTIGATLKRDRDRQGTVPRVEELAVSPDASRLAVVSNEYVGLWNLADNARVWRSEGPVGRAIAFSPDGRTFATGADDGIVWWRDYDGGPFREFRWDVGEIHALAFSPDGLTCAAAGLKGKVVVWDVDS